MKTPEEPSTQSGYNFSLAPLTGSTNANGHEQPSRTLDLNTIMPYTIVSEHAPGFGVDAQIEGAGRGLPRRPAVNLNGSTPEGYGQAIDPATPRGALEHRLAELQAMFDENNKISRGSDNLGTQMRIDAAVAASAYRIEIDRLTNHLNSLPPPSVPANTESRQRSVLAALGSALGSLAVTVFTHRRGSL